jgi:glycosyltransferase involved in cell wall biosynthesis
MPMPRQELLYISPVIPAASGNGLAMRAATVIEALSEYYSVSLLVVRLHPGVTSEIPREIRAACRRALVTDPTRPGVLDRFRLRLAAATRWRHVPFAVVHAFRLVTLPFAQPFFAAAAAPPRRWLDLDEVDSAKHCRIAELCRANGDLSLAAFEEQEARRSQVLEDEAWPSLDRVFVCSSEERHRIVRRARVEVRVLPNAVRLPAPPAPPDGSEAFRFLFAGTLGYYPNEDAALHLCRDIVPRLRELLRRPFEVEIVGGDASARLREAASASGVRLAGAVPAMDPFYSKADAVLAPIRAGGGTRIKILEAFSYRRPVVTTTAGAEGLDARHERDLLVGDGAGEFAVACARLVEDRELSLRLSENAFRLVEQSYSVDALRHLLEPAERAG